MDYRKIIKSREMRLKILEALSFIPDDLMLRLQYFIQTGRFLNLKNPKRFSEKVQWYKLHYKNPNLIKCVDKYDVRGYISSKSLNRILVPCLGVFEDVNDIDWDKLPDSFVMKDTLGGGGTSVIVVKNKNVETIERLISIAKKWTKTKINIKSGGREWPYYSGKPHRIIFEEYITPSNVDIGLIDYKFFCFNGKVIFIYVMGNRDFGNSVSVGIYDENFRLLPVKRKGLPVFKDVERPSNFEEMKRIAELLSKDFPHVRVDLYNEQGRIFFGELTFYTGSGYISFEPDSFDIEIGKAFKLT